jgi:hypothetical protein
MPVAQAVSLTAMLAEQQIHGLMYVDDAMLYEQPTGHVIRTRNWAQSLPEEQRPVFTRSIRWRRRPAKSTRSGNSP